ncbi:GCR1-dependent translation factor 1 [Dimargaris verticillata]|uniref:GDT1 family protein n=1 Tax=Dimargaris verticillata TaxID=2761393 RepID=A0A9W8B4T7_9FUNG|nr:GCR1-dependent translation factor 1 [Dimargaris verticillata]
MPRWTVSTQAVLTALCLGLALWQVALVAAAETTNKGKNYEFDYAIPASSSHQTTAAIPAATIPLPGVADDTTPLVSASLPTTARLGYLSHDQAQAFVSSILMTVVSEIGDKTFFIAAIMAMKHSRMLIFSAAISALAVMTVLSAVMGRVLPSFLPRNYVNLAAALLFLIFGIKMLIEGWEMDADHAQKELEETSAELDSEKKKEEAIDMEAGEFTIGGGDAMTTAPPMKRTNSRYARSPNSTMDTANAGDGNDAADGTKPFALSPRTAANKQSPPGLVERLTRLVHLVFSPAFLQTALIMFVAEWGDRSQLTTIALAAAQGVVWVSLGTILGHSLCTGLAVIGGRFLATQISVRTVTLSGGFLFILFGLVYAYEGYTMLYQ